MPRAPDKIRNQEIDIINNIRNILLNDEYIQEQIKGPATGQYLISDESLIMQTINFYGLQPVIAVYFNGETQFNRNTTGQYTQQTASKYYIDVAAQATQEQSARNLAYKFCKDIKYTLGFNRNLAFAGTAVKVADSDVISIEPSLFDNLNNLWTYIFTIQMEILTYDCVR